MVKVVLALWISAEPIVSQTPQEWVALGERVHGGFGTHIALGIRIGLDALDVLGAKRRELDVTFYEGTNSPCPCIADGILIAASASPGQGTLRIAGEKAPDGLLALVVIRHRNDGRILRYEVPDAIRDDLAAWNREKDPLGRYQAVIAADEARLFSRRRE
jgi:formylmethanofuran dehydrogenase subunit E